MLDSMFIGLSGLSAFSGGLRDVSNNITNLNSLGYKGSSLVFRDLYGSGSALGYGGAGGNGQGVSLAVSQINFDQGELRQSDSALDLAVDGRGFLVLEKDGDYFFARTGNFEVNSDGYIVLAGTDYRLTVLGEDGRATALSINSHRTSYPQATNTIKFADNISSSALSYNIADIQVYNSNGDSANWSVSFSREETDPSDEWSVAITNSTGDEIGSQKLIFENGVPKSGSEKLLFEDAANGYSVTLDFSENVTSFSAGNVSTLRAADVDGFGIGDIINLSVNDDGQLEVQYSNEQTEELGAVALADFRDTQSLEQKSGGVFVNLDSRGVSFHGSSSDRVGTVLSNRLESSNVELSSEFGSLILVQRGYQAASQIVSVSNEMIQQLFQARGQ